jgi:hypothetical protein
MTETRDYNGSGNWSAAAIQERYLRHAKSMRQKKLRDLTATEHFEGSARWVYPVMDKVIDGIEAGDAACIELGVEFIECAGKQPFGRALQGNTARALRRAKLSLAQINRLRARILALLVKGQVPREFREYAKLLRRIGAGPGWGQAVAGVDRPNPYVMRYVQYLERHGGAT